jgi:hypothetical protein
MTLGYTGKACLKEPSLLKETFVPACKSSKEHLTVMCCGNASGNHKIKLEVIGKAKKPWSFKATETTFLSIITTRKKHGWRNF